MRALATAIAEPIGTEREDVLRLLLVDDDIADIRAIERNLEQSALLSNLEVLSNPEQLEQQIQTEQYDCLLLDYRFPTGTAFELFADLFSKPCSRRPAIVLLTGMGAEDVAAQSIQRGAQEYMSKADLAPHSLRRLIESACEKAQLQRNVEARDAQLVRMSFYDSLTELPNRQLFFDRLGQAVRDAARSNNGFAVLMMDLNLFKSVNDTYGHDAGDRLLKETAKRLQQAVRESDTVARLGGDEFAVLLPTADNIEGAIVVAEKICTLVEEVVSIDEHLVRVGISTGIAMYPDHGNNIESLLRHADVAMYEAKKSKHHIAVYGARGIESEQNSALIAQGLRSALLDDQLFVHYQPQIRLSDGVVIGAEALVRWHHPELGLLPPGKFVPAAERTEIIEALTLHVIKLSLEQNRRWRDSGLDLMISVNLSARLLDHPDLAEQIETLLLAMSIPPDKLCLEVTETGIMNFPNQAEQTLTMLSRRGIQISIDDFGTGYSSLKYLRNFPIDEIKIDRLFVSGLCSQQRDNLIVESILALGKAFKVRVVAEGIEDDISLHHLRELECDYGQGFQIAKPMTANAFSDWHRDWQTQTKEFGTVT